MRRPGDALLECPVAAALRGQPGPAHKAALEASRDDPADAAAHMVDAAVALLVAGEPRAAAMELLADPIGTTDTAMRQRAACFGLADQFDHNWYPGDTGAEFTGEQREPPLMIREVTEGDCETMLLESCIVNGPVPLLSLRALSQSFIRQPSPALASAMQSGLAGLGTLATLAERCEADATNVWAQTTQADLMWRVGQCDNATQLLGVTREARRSREDAVGVAMTLLVEGDWYATPASSPQALGYELTTQQGPSRLSDLRDLARAEALYNAATDALQTADAPRLMGALALRRASLAWAAYDYDEQREALDRAQSLFAFTGDVANAKVVMVHRLLCDVASGEPATVRLVAATGWDLRARGPILELLAWASQRGSISFATGLGRLLQRAGEDFETRGDFDRAAVCLSMALPLIYMSSHLLAGTVLEALARVDGRRNAGARTLVRLEQALDVVPAVTAVQPDPRPWMQHLELLMSIMAAYSNRVGSSASGLGIDGMERATARLAELAAVADLPTQDVSDNLLQQGAALLQDIAQQRAGDQVSDIGEDMFDAATAQMLGMAAQSARDQVAMFSALTALQRGRLAQRGGWSDEANRWFERALALLDEGPAEYYWIAVLVCSVWGRDDEALSRFREAEASGLLPPDLLAILALRARDFERALALFAVLDGATPSEGLPWSDQLDRVEALLESGHVEEAEDIAEAAIERFEATVATVGRDPDRLALCDDIKATSLYMLAGRAALLRATAEQDDGRVWAALADSFEAGDRGRSLALAGLLAGVREDGDGDETMRSWQQAATEWSAAFERLLAAYEGASDETTPLAQELTRVDDELVATEAALESKRPGILADARALPPTPRLAELQGFIPADACVLQYHLVGRDLMTWVVTDQTIAGHHVRLPAALEGQIGTYWRSCAAGAAWDEDAELARLLLDPAADVLRDRRRAIVVPFGALSSVPFHTLSFDGHALGDDHVLSYLPAASLLAGRSVDAPLTRSDVLVVGDPAFDPDAHPSLRRLPGAAVEAAAVGRAWGSADVLVDAEAEEPTVRELLPGRGIVHFAAHGRLDEIAPSTSSLILAGADELTVSDLIGLRADSELALLSACDSGRGTATLGGDVVGLTRGLIAAGVQRAIVSLWPVDDMAACVTMATFHERLADHAVPAVALAEAQASMQELDAQQIAARYRELGGDPGVDMRSARRGSDSGAISVPPRRIAMNPQFVDIADDDPELGQLDGSLERIWAPFVMVGV